MKNRVINQLFISLLVMFFGLILSSQKISAASSDDLSFTNYATRDETEYNILPLILDPSLYMVGGPSNKDQLISNMVSDQGYEAQCAKQDWEITPQVYGALEEYFASGKSGAKLSGESTYTLDLTNTTIPLFRGDEDFTETRKSSSFEGFFGANKPDPTADETEATGVANLLLTTEQQCIAKSDNLYSVFGENGICDKLKDPNQCALNYEISGSTLTTKKLFEKIDKLFKKTNGEENFNCSNLVQPWDEDSSNFGVSKSDHELASSAISLMPLNMDRLYRMAFLVIAPEQKPIDRGVFGFLQQEETSIKRQAPIIIGFKIPYVATNSIESLPLLRDASLLTAYTLTAGENIDARKQSVVAFRNKTIEKIRNNIKDKPSGLIINCDGVSQCSGSNDDGILRAAVIEIINGSGSSCRSEDIVYELAGDLGSPAGLDEDKKFKNPYFSEILPIKEDIYFTWQTLIRDESIKNSLKEESIPVTAHIVSPLGNNPESDMEFIANSMKIFFNEDDFAKMVEANCVVDSEGKCGVIPEFLTLAGSISELSGTNDSFGFFTDAGCDDLPPEEQKACRTKSIGGSVEENPKKPLVILGGKIGWMIRKVQENLSVLSQKAHDYISSCERTEDLFLGRCEGYIRKPLGNKPKAVCESGKLKEIKNLPSYNKIPTKAKDYFNNFISERITQELVDAYAATEKETGIPCEIVAGIHYMEGGMRPNQSLFDGGSLHGNIEEDAIGAMEHLIVNIKRGGGDPSNLTYQSLAAGLAHYNGLGNGNCVRSDSQWFLDGKCSPYPPKGEDHLYPNSWVDEDHLDMDLIFCKDTVAFNCKEDGDPVEIEQRYKEVMLKNPPNGFVEHALTACFQSGSICKNAGETGVYPPFRRPGVFTTAIIMNELSKSSF